MIELDKVKGILFLYCVNVTNNSMVSRPKSDCDVFKLIHSDHMLHFAIFIVVLRFVILSLNELIESVVEIKNNSTTYRTFYK